MQAIQPDTGDNHFIMTFYSTKFGDKKSKKSIDLLPVMKTSENQFSVYNSYHIFINQNSKLKAKRSAVGCRGKILLGDLCPHIFRHDLL